LLLALENLVSDVVLEQLSADLVNATARNVRVENDGNGLCFRALDGNLSFLYQFEAL